jgi:hypothetical protein
MNTLEALLEPKKTDCPHPLDKLCWYDGSLHCFVCRNTWHKDFPFGLQPKVWGRVTADDLPHDYQI